MNGMNYTAIAIEAAGGPTKVARELNVSPQAACFWRDGKRELPPEHCATLERLSAYQVRRWHLRPLDWHVIWPELVGSEDAPVPDGVATQTDVAHGG